MTPDHAAADASRPAAQGRLRERPWTVEDLLARYGLGLALLLLVTLFGAMSRPFLTADNALSVLRQVGAYSARMNLTGIYRAYRRSSIHEFFDNGARLHSKFQDFGEAAYLKSSEFSSQMVHASTRSSPPSRP